MINLLKNYRKIFFSYIKCEFAENPGEAGEQIDSKSFKGDSLQDLKALKKVVDDKVIDDVEAQIIIDNANEITSEAKLGLDEMSKSVLDNGLSVGSVNAYISFQKLLAKSGIIIPTYPSLITKVQGVEDANFKELIGIDVKGDYGVVYFKNDKGELGKINFSYNGKNINIKGDVEAYSGSNDFVSYGFVDEKILDDNIENIELNNLEKVEPKQEDQPESKEEEQPESKEEEQPETKQEDQPEQKQEEQPEQKEPKQEKKEVPVIKNTGSKRAYVSPEKIKQSHKKSPKEFFNKYSIEERKEIQRMLKVVDDGKFGPNTHNAILKFQKENKLVQDGKVGPITLGKLKELNSVNKSKGRDQIDDMFDNPNSYDVKSPTQGTKNTEQNEYKNEDQGTKPMEQNESKSEEVSFIGENGEEVFVRYDEKNMGLYIYTSYFDGIDDFNFNNGQFKYKEEALLYLENHIDEVKEAYDKKIREANNKD